MSCRHKCPTVFSKCGERSFDKAAIFTDWDPGIGESDTSYVNGASPGAVSVKIGDKIEVIEAYRVQHHHKTPVVSGFSFLAVAPGCRSTP